MFNLKKFATLYSTFKKHPDLNQFDPKRGRGDHPTKSSPQEKAIIESLVAEMLLSHFGADYNDTTRELAFSVNISEKNLPKLFTLPLNQIQVFTNLKRKDLIAKGAERLKNIQNQYGFSDETICSIAISPLKKARTNESIISEVKNTSPDSDSAIITIWNSIEGGIRKGVLKQDKADPWKNICLDPQRNLSEIQRFTNDPTIVNFFDSLEEIKMGDITMEAFGIYAAKPYEGQLFINGEINPAFAKDILRDLFAKEKDDLSEFTDDDDEDNDQLSESVKYKILNSLKSENPSKSSMNLRQLCRQQFAKKLTPEENEKLLILIERIRFPKQYDLESYLEYIADVLVEAGYQDEWVNGVIMPTVRDEYIKYVKGIEDPEFGKNSRSFSSDAEKKMITEVIRDKFNLTCIPSGIHIPVPGGVPAGEIPKTSDPNKPFDRFRIDFVIYTDTLEFIDQGGIKVPHVKPNIMLIGEYYGIVDDEMYDKKREIKEATESYFAHALGCGYIGIEYQRDQNWIGQVKDGLDLNNALYVPKIPDIRCNAVHDLSRWIGQNDINMVNDKSLIEKYVDLNNKRPKSDLIKYNKFLGLVRSCRNRLDSESAEKAVTLMKAEDMSNIYSYGYVLNWYQNWKQDRNQENQLRNVVTSSIDEGRKNNQWKYQVLDELEKEVEQTVPERVNKTNICGLIYRLTDKQTKERCLICTNTSPNRDRKQNRRKHKKWN